MKRKVCIVSSSRADYGLLKNLMFLIQKDKNLDLRIIITGSHLSIKHGYTVKEIQNDGFKLESKVRIHVNSESSKDIAKSTSLAITGVSNSINQIKPDIIILLGDRFEILASAIASLLNGVPIAHLHGGESSEGAYDEAFRHSITKMSHLHFVSSKQHRKNVIQLGEKPNSVFHVGGLGAEAIERIKLYSKKETEKYLKVSFKKKNLLITFHSTTLEKKSAIIQIKELLKSLKHLDDTLLIFTKNNIDTDGDLIWREIIKFSKSKKNFIIRKSLGQKLFYSTLRIVDGIVGNSSSGILEAPSFKKATINIGDRQKGRLRAISVIDCPPKSNYIIKAIKKVYNLNFQKKLIKTRNPYYKKGTALQIVKVIKKYPLKNILKKEFYIN